MYQQSGSSRYLAATGGYWEPTHPSRPSSSGFPHQPQLDRPPHRTPYSVSLPRELTLVTNAYNLQSTSPSRTLVYEYSLKVSLSSGSRDVPERVLKRNAVLRCLRNLVVQLIRPNLRSASVIHSVVIASDLETLYCNQRLVRSPSSTGPEELVSDQFRFSKVPVQSDLVSLLHVDIVLRFSKSYQFDMKNHNLLTAILHHQLLTSMIRYGSVYFMSENIHHRDQTDRLDLSSKLSMGLSLSGVRGLSNERPMVVINCPHCYLTGSHRLIDLLASFVYSQSIDNVGLYHQPEYADSLQVDPELANITGRESWFKEFFERLNGFKCKGNLQNNDVNIKFNLTDRSASELFLVDPNDHRQYTVYAYLYNMGINLNYPNLPCMKSPSSTFPYYPLELCSLVAGQKVPAFRLGTNARNDLAIKNKSKPDQSLYSTRRARDKVSSICGPQFQSFGVQLSREPVPAIGSSLQKPTLKFANQSFEPLRDYWESGVFYDSKHLDGNWVVVDTVGIDSQRVRYFFDNFDQYCTKFGFKLGRPRFMFKSKQEISDRSETLDELIEDSLTKTRGNLRLLMFLIDTNSTSLNRLVHLVFDEHPHLSAACLRVESVMNNRQHRAIFRTLIHKLNARLGGTNVIYDDNTLTKLDLRAAELMIIGLDVTHPDNELSGVSIVGCAYTYSQDLFKHRSLAWPQGARVEIIGKMDVLIIKLLKEYHSENKRQLPAHVIIYRDGVSHEEFGRVKEIEISKVLQVFEKTAQDLKLPKPKLSYVIAQKRHTMRFYRVLANKQIVNPPSGTLIDKDIVAQDKHEFYLYSNTNPQATARPLHYHILWDELGVEKLQKLTYYLCFNFGKCSGSLSMPSSLRYAHNAAYEARNRVITAKEFSENNFYSSKFFC